MMSKMYLINNVDDNIAPYRDRLEVLTSKEVQLKMLHDEITTKREALLRTSKNFLQKVSPENLPLSNIDAPKRNNSLLQHMNKLDEKINESLQVQSSPRFSNLQANYWSMVRNMFPIWKKSLEELQ